MNLHTSDGLTVGQVLGIHPLHSKVPIKYQFKSMNDGKWKDCKNEWDMKCYEKYHYETRTLFK